MYTLTILLVTLCCWTESAKIYVPKVEDSYRAIGEILMDEPMMGRCMVTFEENYDKESRMASFWHSLLGFNTTILEYLTPGMEQSFQYFPHKETCERLYPEEWDGSGAGSGLRPSVKTPGGQLILPVRELLSLNETDLADGGWGRPRTTFRGLQANWFTFEVESGNDKLQVDAYWSDGRGGSTMSSNKEIPLGFTVTRIKGPQEKPDVHVVNIHYFAHFEVNRQMLQPMRGIYCPKRKEPISFPDFGQTLNMAWSTEHRWKELSMVTGNDMWLDGQNRILRSDFQIMNSVGYSSVTMIVIFDQSTVFYINKDKARNCRVTDLKDEPYYSQILLDPRDKTGWTPEVFFRGNNHFFRLTQRNEHGVLCDVYQGTRWDWPLGDQGNVTSVWEWCFASNDSSTAPDVKVSITRLPLVSLDIYVKESPYKEGDSGKPYVGQRLSYKFYNVRQMEPTYMDVLAFDISPCFGPQRMSLVTFSVDLTPSDRKFLMKEESDVKLIALWRNEIYKATQLPTYSLRISNIKMGMDDDDDASPLRVQVLVLDRHPDLPNRSDSIGLDKAIANLKDVIDKTKLTIKYEDEKIFSSLTVKPGSMEVLDSEGNQVARSPPPAFFRAKAEAARVRKDKVTSSNTPWLVGLLSLQVGVSLGVVAVAVRKWKKSRLDNQSTTNTNTL